MLQRQNYFIVILGLSMVFVNNAMAIERDHDAMQHDTGHVQHDGMNHKVVSGKHSIMNADGKQTMSSYSAREENTLVQLDSVPASGKSREAGYDGRYAMEPTRHDDDIATQCAKASRGLVMIDKATLSKCNDKVSGTTAEVSGSTTMMDHSSH